MILNLKEKSYQSCLLSHTIKTLTATAFVFFISLQLNAQLEQDKAKHFVAGALSGAIGADIADRYSGGDRYWKIAAAFTSSLLVGLAKEAYDEKQYGGWDNKDLAATVLGGISIGITIDIFSEKKHRKQQLYSVDSKMNSFLDN